MCAPSRECQECDRLLVRRSGIADDVMGLTDGLVLHLHLDEESGTTAVDSSGNGNDGTTSGVVVEANFCRARAFAGDWLDSFEEVRTASSGMNGPQGINIPSSSGHPTLEFGTGSFSVMGWAKFDDYTYPRTSFVSKNGHGCYFGDGRAGWNPGWEIGHGFNPVGSDVCIRDSDDNRARGALQYDTGSRPVDLLGVCRTTDSPLALSHPHAHSTTLCL